MFPRMFRSGAHVLVVSIYVASAFTSDRQVGGGRRRQQHQRQLQGPTHNHRAASATESSSSQDDVPFGKVQQPSAGMVTETGTYSARDLLDNGLEITEDEDGRVSARPKKNKTAKAAAAAVVVVDNGDGDGDTSDETSASSDTVVQRISKDAVETKVPEPQQKRQQQQQSPPPPPTLRPNQPQIIESPATVVPMTGFNVVLTHATADFDSLASAVGLAKLWSAQADPDTAAVESDSDDDTESTSAYDSASHVPTFVVLPRGAHPAVQRFLALHKHLFPIRSLKSLPSDLSGLNRLALVDAQRRDRLGPAVNLLEHANRVTVVDHHIDQDSDIPATDYVVDAVGSVSTLISERLKKASDKICVTEAEATLLALGIHADTGSLCFDSTTVRDAQALAWCLEQGASQDAIAEHAHNSLSKEQQGVLTQALINTNSTVVHGVTVSTVLLSADGFINGLAAVTQDALELSSSDVFLLSLVYEAQPGGRRRRKTKGGDKGLLTSRLLSKDKSAARPGSDPALANIMYTEAWQGGEEHMQKRRLRSAFDRKDTDGSGFLEENEIAAALAASGVIASSEAVSQLMESMDTDGNGKIDFEEFVTFADDAKKRQEELNQKKNKSTTMIIIGRVKAGVSIKSVKLNKMFERFGGGGHTKAASATVRLNEESEAQGIMQDLVDELVETSLQEQPTVADFMTAPALSIKQDMVEKQVEALFTRYDVRALPVVDDNNEVIGLVTYKEVAAAKQRMWNKEQKRLRQERKVAERGDDADAAASNSKGNKKKKGSEGGQATHEQRKRGSTVKAWMLQHVQVVEASKTMAEVETILLENDVGCIPVVADGTKELVGICTRTDLLRQHRYYSGLHYHNKGFSDSIAARKPIIELRKKLKQFDLDE